MVQGVKQLPTVSERLRMFQNHKADIYSLMRIKNRTVPPSSAAPIFGQASGGGLSNTNEFLKTSGDSMIGPIAFYPNAVTIAAGAIDIGADTDKFAGRIILNGQGAADDDLDTITGAKHAGQLVIFQAVSGQNITLKNLTDNFRSSSGADIVLNSQDNIWLVFDAVANQWTDIGGVGSVSFPLTPDIKAHGNVTGATTIDLSLTTAHYQEMTLTGNVTFTFSNPPADNKEISFILDILQDAIGGRTITWPASVRVDPTISSGANVRTVVVCSTVDNGTNYDVIIAAGSDFATKELDNLASVAINTSLISDTDNTDDLGSATKEWRNLYIDGTANIDTIAATTISGTLTMGGNIDMENNNIIDCHQIQLTGSSGDTVIGLLTSAGSTLDISVENTSGIMRFSCDDSGGTGRQVIGLTSGTLNSSNTIEFNKNGSGFAILDEIGSLSFAVASGGEPSILGIADSISIQTSGSSEVLIADGSTIFRTTTSDTGSYDIKIIQDNNTPSDNRALGNIDFVAENSSSVDSIYARITATSKDVTNGTEDGLLELGVASAGALVAGISIEGGTSSLVKLGFYGATPVALQTGVAVTAAGIHAALVNLGLITA